MDRFCTKCGQRLAANAAFCTSCGTPAPVQNDTANQSVSLSKPGENVQQAQGQNPSQGYQQNQGVQQNQGYQQNQGFQQNQAFQQNQNQGFQQNPNMPYQQHNPHMNQNLYQQNNTNMGYDPRQDIPPEIRSKCTIAIILGIVGLVFSIIGSILFGLFLSIPGIILGVVACVMGVNLKKYSNGVIGTGPMVIGIIAITLASIFTIGCSLAGCGEHYLTSGIIGESCRVAKDYYGGASELRDLFRDFN